MCGPTVFLTVRESGMVGMVARCAVEHSSIRKTSWTRLAPVIDHSTGSDQPPKREKTLRTVRSLSPPHLRKCTPLRSRLWSPLLLLACLTFSSPALAAECPNEQLRQESNVNPSTGRPYSAALPDCRAYEMVSPAEKDGTLAGEVLGPSSAAGEAVTFGGRGSFAGLIDQRGLGGDYLAP